MRGRGGKGNTITGFLMSAKQGFLYPAASSQFFFFFKDAAPFSTLEIKQLHREQGWEGREGRSGDTLSFLTRSSLSFLSSLSSSSSSSSPNVTPGSISMLLLKLAGTRKVILYFLPIFSSFG